MKTFRFHHDQGWSRWYKEDEDFTLMQSFFVDAIEVSEELPRAEFWRQYPKAFEHIS